MSSVHCSIAPPAAVRLLESKGRHFSEFTVLGFLPSTTDASVVPWHGLLLLLLFIYLIVCVCSNRLPELSHCRNISKLDFTFKPPPLNRCY